MELLASGIEEGSEADAATPGYAGDSGEHDVSQPLMRSAPATGHQKFVGALMSALLLAVGATWLVSVGSQPSKARKFIPRDLETVMTPPAWALDLAQQAGDGNSRLRGEGLSDGKGRIEMAHVFNGTHVTGYPPGEVHGVFWIWEHLRVADPDSGEFGPVKLSENATLLRAAFEQLGFEHGTFYHGTRNLFAPSILAGGYLFARQHWYGRGIYVCTTFEHAQCYSSGDDGPVMEMEIYWNPDNKTRYLTHVPHQSMAADVYVVSDPLLIMPVAVHRCCPKELNCL